MGFIIGLWRRFFGGYDSVLDILEERGLQCVFLVSLVFFWEFGIKDFDWVKSLLTAVAVYIFFCTGHFYYFMCSTESDEYIDEQEAKGRKPAMDWLVKLINKIFDFEPRSKQYCFLGMATRYIFWSIPVAYLVGWHFVIVGCTVPFIYNACFWVDFPPMRFAKSPTNWAEFFTGLFVGWGLY